MNKPNPRVDGYIRKLKKWKDELQALRAILLDSPLTEDVKWRVPCYTFEGKNVVILITLKDCCVLSFVKGALLKDPQGILVKPGENTQSGRVIRFTGVDEITALEPVLKAYVREAAEAEKNGAKVAYKKITEFAVPQELQEKLDGMPALKAAFNALTPGRQRGYLLHFSGAKQSKTRTSRVEKCVERILKGKGLDD
ncbi:MAG TPA: YdeI/OmpD-associated family protein [Tepidisphaeraceae bacterium]